MNPRSALRQDPEVFIAQLKRKGFVFDEKTYQTLESSRKKSQSALESCQAKRNQLSKEIGQRKSKGEDATELMDQVVEVNQQLDALQGTVKRLQHDLESFLLHIPNTPLESVPDGQSETDNVEIRSWGEKTSFDFTPKDHVTLGEQLNALDFQQAGHVAGARFTYLLDDLARLHRVLAQWMIDFHSEKHGYREVNVPVLVHDDAMQAAGQYPKFKDDAYQLAEESKSLIPTGEVPLVNYCAKTIQKEKALPIKMTCHSLCFRREAGSYGKDTRGMIRMHQFEKVELVQFVEESQGLSALETMCQEAEAILQALALPYRVVELCTGDLGFCAKKTYDLEVWLPSQNTYREISSISYCGDFQSRRLQARLKKGQDKPTLLHSLNGSGVAVGRALVAVLENYQDADGHIHVPSILQGRMGKKVLSPYHVNL